MVNSAHKKTIKQIFRQHGGILRTSELLGLGIHPRTIYQLRDDAKIAELSRGVYRLAELPPLENSDLITVAKRIPSGVICLLSALSFHGITEEIPHEVYVAIERGREKPKVNFPPIRVFHFSQETHTTGVETYDLEGNQVKVYSKEKTVADCFKFRNRIGLDIALNAARQCIGKGGSRSEILKFARICRVENVIRPYLEAIQ